MNIYKLENASQIENVYVQENSTQEKTEKIIQKTNAKTYRRRKVVGGVKGENNPDEKRKTASKKNDPKPKPVGLGGIRRSPKYHDLKELDEVEEEKVLVSSFASSTLNK